MYSRYAWDLSSFVEWKRCRWKHASPSLGCLQKCHTILVLFLRNKRVDKLVMNRNHLTAAELFYSQKQEVTLHYLLFMCAEHSILSSSCCSRALRKLTKPNRTKIHFSVRVGLIVWFCFAIFKNVLVFGSVQ